MAHIPVRDGLPGIIGLLDFDPEAAAPLGALAQVVLRRDVGISPAEREIIAAHVSRLNRCFFCANSHEATARHLAAAEGLHDPLSPKLQALLRIAEKVQIGGRNVSEEEVSVARGFGASDQDIHDTVLIAASFCMYNRYVDGLATFAPQDAAVYDGIGSRLAAEGYVPDTVPA